jgi:hypothetical protein
MFLYGSDTLEFALVGHQQITADGRSNWKKIYFACLCLSLPDGVNTCLVHDTTRQYKASSVQFRF